MEHTIAADNCVLYGATTIQVVRSVGFWPKGDGALQKVGRHSQSTALKIVDE